MKNNQSNKPLKLSIRADKPVVPAGKKAARILEATLSAPPAPQDSPQIPLNLSLVIDHSGSMQGEKLHYVKEAAAHVLSLMSEKDRMALVIYDDKVTTLMPSQTLTEAAKSEAISKIRQVQSGASTFLYGGWLAGCRQVAEALSEGKDTFNRTLLLTDGLANVGERDIGALSLHAQELFTRHISTSCFGVGLDYDEHLLESMANHGGGSFHFLETLTAIPLVFQREFEEILSLTLRDLKISLTLPENVEASVAANWQAVREGNQWTIFLGGLMANQTQRLYLQLANLSGEIGEPIDIPLVVTGLGRDQADQKVTGAITLQPVPVNEADAIEQDSDLMARFAAVDLADKANQALKRERAGDREGSARLMMGSLSQHQSHILASDQLKYKYFTDEIREGLDEAERKRHHYMEYQSRRGHMPVRHYPLSFENGALVAQIEGRKVLVHTGVQHSLGAEPEWSFLHEVYPLKPEHAGFHIKALSNILGTRVDVMLGMDILRDLYLRIEPQRSVITFNRTPLKAYGRIINLADTDPMLSLRVPVAGTETLMQVMTGIGFSFLPAGLLSEHTPAHQRDVVIPGLAAFSTPIYTIPMDFSGVTVRLKCGMLPESVQANLGLGAQDGILGAQLFQTITSTLAIPQKQLELLI